MGIRINRFVGDKNFCLSVVNNFIVSNLVNHCLPSQTTTDGSWENIMVYKVEDQPEVVLSFLIGKNILRAFHVLVSVHMINNLSVLVFT